MVILKYILIFFAVLWLLGTVFKYFIRGVARSIFGGEQPAPQKKTKPRKQGEIHIEKQPPREKKIKENVGEYIDYEEIK
ncbi:MAG: DUF4834 family protein [Prevotellaceae bacterium]|jgi:hypothetical protein|nr:DUF4834 family protein [Prevotellaceae bacterium]